MKTKVTRVLSLMLVAGLLIAIPASTQMFGTRLGAEEGEVDLGMLVTVNRLELSEDQMVELKDLIDGLLVEKEALDVARTQFEEEMIAFNGTSEELDERLAAFRDSQAEASSALRDSAAEALDGAKDLLSINQGEVIQEALRNRMGIGVQAMSGARQGMMLEQRDGQTREFDGLPEEMLDAIEERLEAFDGELPEALLERLEMHEERAAEGFGQRFGDSELEFGGGIRGQSGRMMMQRGQGLQSNRDGSMSVLGSGQLFEVLEQLSEILELKLEALQ